MVIITGIAVAALIFYVAVMWSRREKVEKWGRYVALLWGFGLFICCLAATRDNYYLSVQNMIDSSTQVGLFTVSSIQSNICCILGGLNFLIGLLTLIIRKQNWRKVFFFILSADVIIKIFIIELSRIFL